MLLQTHPPADAALLDAFIATRCEQSFRALVERHASWIFAAAFRQLHDRQLAEDATQTTFLILAQKAQSMSDTQKKKLSGWLFTTLSYTIKNLKRTRQCRQKYEEDLAHQASHSGQTPDPTEVLALADVLDVAVAKLSAADRDAILIRFYQDRPVEDIADALNTTHAAAAKRLTRALARLRSHLAGSKSSSPGALLSFPLAAAATHGLADAPSTLVGSITHLATHSAVVPIHLATSIKGATTLMATAKLKTAIALTAAALLAVAVPATLLTLNALNNPASAATAPIAAPAPPPASQPVAAAEPDSPYTLAPGQIITLVPLPFPDSRHTLFQNSGTTMSFSSNSSQSKTTVSSTSPTTRSGGGLVTFSTDGINRQSRDPDAAIFDSQDGKAARVLNAVSSAAGNSSLHVKNILQTILQIPADRIEGQKPLLDHQIPGDFVVNMQATDNERRAALEKILSDQFETHITLQFKDVPTDAYVLRGEWKPIKPAADGKIHFYTEDMSPDTEVGNGMTSGDGLGQMLDRFLNTPVILISKNVPSPLHFVLHRGIMQHPDPTAVLNHITEQTGLTWKEEKTPLRHLTIEEKQ